MSISGKIFEGLVQSLAKELYAYAVSLCRDKQLAEDLVQETYLRAWRSIHSLKDPKCARAWLYTILKREHARAYRKTVAAREQSLPEELYAGKSYDTSTEAWVLRQAIYQLPETYREPLLLQVLGGFSGKEIARILDLTQANVLARVSRARRMLREQLEQPEKSIIEEKL